MWSNRWIKGQDYPEWADADVYKKTITGGYLLSKSPNEIKLLSIIKAVDEKVETVGCKKESKKGCTGKSIKCITHSLWDDLENHINSFFEKNTLTDIVYKSSKDKQKELIS